MNKNNYDSRDFQNLLDHMRRTRGFDFSGYKRASLERRVQKRMQTIQVESYADYLDFLEIHPEEFIHLFNTILINVTDFFRDAASWDYLEETIIPRIIASKASDEPIRVWCAAVASGEEAYSIAILLAEALGTEPFLERVKIYASDVDDEALNEARQASYPHKALTGVSPERLSKYFDLRDGEYVFRKDLRRAVIFGRHDLVVDAPISRIDLLICRNVLMYFNTETQGRILSRLHFGLNNTGFLFVGKAEMLFTYSSLFLPVELKRRVFSKVPAVTMRDRMSLMPPRDQEDNPTYLTRNMRLREAALEASPQAQLIIDLNGQLALANSAARHMFGLTTKEIGRSLADLDLSAKIGELPMRIREAYAERGPTTIKNAPWTSPEGQVYHLQAHIAPLNDSTGTLLGATLTFTDQSQFRQLQKELEHANEELETAYEELQSTNEELETTNEELQSTIEELETTNEELQSTNEELETINEELQSTNEEMQNMNDEMRRRTDDLDQVNIFLNSILTSLQGAVIVVNAELMVQIWNEQAQNMWGLSGNEVKGRNLLNLDIGLPVEELRPVLRAGLAREYDYREVVISARNRRGKDFHCIVTVTPLVGTNNGTQGVILVMEERGARPKSPLDPKALPDGKNGARAKAGRNNKKAKVPQASAKDRVDGAGE